MNGRKLFREYAKTKGKDCQEFLEIINEFYQNDTLKFKDSSGTTQTMTIDYKDMIHWIIKTKNFKDN